MLVKSNIKFMQKINKIITNNNTLISNFTWLSFLQIFLLIAPLITYPYLVKILGIELYGLIITAHVLASYASLVIDFGSNKVCAKHVSVCRENINKLSEIISSVLVVRLILFVICFFVYASFVLLLPRYRSETLLFILTYGVTLNEVLFPQYFFQGMEKMKYSTIVNIIIKIVFIILVFIVVRDKSDYLWVPILYTLGYTLGGVYALYIIFKRFNVHFIIPPQSNIMIYVKESIPLLATDLVCTIKDKLNYLLLGAFCSMGHVVIYDLGMKIYTLTGQPTGIISMVLFPRSAKTKSIRVFHMVLFAIIIINLLLIAIVNLFLPYIVNYFIKENIDLLPIRLFTLAPLFSTTGSYIMSNMCIAFGYNRYALYSILFTTVGYLVLLSVFFFTHSLNNIYSFVLLAVLSYFIEFLYRIYAYNRVLRIETKK